MRASILFFIVGLAALAHGHTTIFNVLVNDVDQRLGNSDSGYIRSPPNNNPVKDLTSKDMTCNVNNVQTAKTISVHRGDKHHGSDSESDDIIDKSHKGPILVYIAPTSSNGAGKVWVKLYEDGYDGSSWAVEKLIKNKGQHSITLPDLASGEYLLRPEIIALHKADTAYNVNSARGAQFYMECVQIKVVSNSSMSLPSGVAIPGVYSYSDPGVVFNLYWPPFTSYPIPGPKVWDGVSEAHPPPSILAASSSSMHPSTIVPCTSTVRTSRHQVAPVVSTTSTSQLTNTTVASSSIALPIKPSAFSNKPIPVITTYVTVHATDCEGLVLSTLLTRPSSREG